MTGIAALGERYTFELPHSLEASEPVEARGLARDSVRMLVAHRDSGLLIPTAFIDLPSHLEPGDVVVINTSGTIPAALDATSDEGQPITVHLSTQLDTTRWVLELRRPVGRTSERWSGPPPQRLLHLRGGASVRLECPFGEQDRLWEGELALGQPTMAWLATHGRPIRYGYVDRMWPIEMYQNVYATEPGSAEMPSAGRPFTLDMITKLVANGIDVAPLILHAGVASLEADEEPYPERVKISASSVARINTARRAGHRVIAVGTTVVRVLETSVSDDGCASAYDGWTDLVISPQRGVRLVDGLITGWHEPASSHLLLLETLIGRDLLVDSYNAALVQGYRWHEFGDVHLILP